MESNAWNIVTGCERLTPGCDNCPTYWGYKERGEDYHPKFNENLLSEPLLNKVPTRYFVAAGSDMFHEAIRLEDIEKAFIVMHMANWHTYEIGSKRIERMAVLSNRGLVWEPHMIAVTAVEESKYKWRIDCLREINARRMVSFGPLVGRVGDVDMTGIEFAGVVVEHWGKPRPVKPEWVTEIEDQCINQGVILSSRYWLCEA